MKFTDGYEDQKITFPMLMKDENKGVIIFANAAGVGMVLWSGQSNVVDAGDIIPWVQSQFNFEDLQFSPMKLGESWTFCVKDM